MIEITVNRDGTVSMPSGGVFLGNKFENLDETLRFTFPDEFQEYNKYLIGYHKRRKVTTILPINNDIFYVTTGLTYLDGDWTLYAMCRQQVLDLSAEKEVDISPKEGEHVFISDGFGATVAANNIDASAINSTVLDRNLQVIYEDLLKVKEELKDEQPIVIDLNIPMNLSDQELDQFKKIEVDDVEVDRTLFLDDEGKCKQYVYVKLSSGGVVSPYEFFCVFARGTVDKIHYFGSVFELPPTVTSMENSMVIGLEFRENDHVENDFNFVLEARSNLLAGMNNAGLVKSDVEFDLKQHAVSVAINHSGYMYVPGYPTLESLNAKPKDFVVNLSSDGGYSIDKTFDEIKEAYDSGRTVYAMLQSSRMDLTYVSDDQFQFESITSYYGYKELIVHSNSSIDYSSGWRTPKSSVYGIVRADRINNDPDYTVPAKFNSKDGKLYVPKYPTLESLNAKPKDFVVTMNFSFSQDPPYMVDKTNQEIFQAYSQGCDVYLKDATYNNYMYKITTVNESYAIFSYDDPASFVELSVLVEEDKVTYRKETYFTPTSSKYGGIKADVVNDNYTVPVKFNSEDGKAYVPEYPNVNDIVSNAIGEYMCTATITGDQDQGFQSDIHYAALLAARNTVLIVYQETGDVYNPSSVDEITGAISATNVKITETGVKISTFTFGSDNSVAYSEKEIPIS